MRADDLPLFYNAVDILENNLEERSGKEALFSPSRTLTFQQVSDEVNQVANALYALDVRIGEVVGLLTYDTPEWVTSFFGTLKVGAISLGLNTLLTPAEYDYILRDSHARVVIVHEDLLPKIEEIREGQPFLKHVIVIGQGGENTTSYADWIRNQPTHAERIHTHREDLATLNYSSGTTGQPKGIPHAHKDLPLTAQLWGVNVLGLQESDRTLAVAKLFFTFGTGGNLIFPGMSAPASSSTPARRASSRRSSTWSLSSGRPSSTTRPPATPWPWPCPTWSTATTSPPSGSASRPGKRCPRLSGMSGRRAPGWRSSTASAAPRSTTSSSPTAPATSGPAAAASRSRAST